MAFASNSGSGPMADMNVTPLVDVMLVLLIIFMVTAPILSYPIDIDLPQKNPNAEQPKKDPPPPIKLAIDPSGNVTWNSSPVEVKDLRQRMTEVVANDPENQPTLEVDVNLEAQYEVLTRVLAAAKDADMKKIGFVKKDQ